LYCSYVENMTLEGHYHWEIDHNEKGYKTKSRIRKLEPQSFRDT